MRINEKELRLYVPLEQKGVRTGWLSARLDPGDDHWRVEVWAEGQNIFRTKVIDLPEMEKDPWAVVKVALARRGRRD